MPGPPAGQIHRYSLLLFAQPSNLTINIVSNAFTMAFTASGKDRVGFNISMFQKMTAIQAPIAGTYFEFGNGTLTQGSGLNLNGPEEFKGTGKKKWVERTVFALGLLLGGGMMLM